MRWPGVLAAVARTVLVMTLVTVSSLAGWVVVPLLWGWDSYTVTSGSMTPLVRRGDVVVAAPADRTVSPGTVVVIAPAVPGGEPVTHRVVEQLPDGRYRTKGDANPQTDSRIITRSEIIGQARLVVPMVGLVPLRFGSLTPVAGVTLIGASLLLSVTRRRSSRPPRHRTRTVSPPFRGADRPASALTAVIGTILVLAVTGATGMTGGTVGTSRAAFSSRVSTGHGWSAGPFYNQMVIASGPVSYYRLGGTGAAAGADTMGTAPMTMVGNPTTGRAGALRADPDRATAFTRSPMSYAIASSAAHSLAGNLSVAAWVKVTLPTVTRCRVVFKGDPTHLNYLMAFDVNGTRMRFLVELASNASRPTAEAAYPTPAGWHFVVGTYDGANVRLYLDGALAATTAAAGTLYTSSLPLTLSRDDAASGLTGDLDEVALWSRALAAAEITALYDAGKP